MNLFKEEKDLNYNNNLKILKLTKNLWKTIKTKKKCKIQLMKWKNKKVQIINQKQTKNFKMNQNNLMIKNNQINLSVKKKKLIDYNNNKNKSTKINKTNYRKNSKMLNQIKKLNLKQIKIQIFRLSEQVQESK